MIYDYIIIYIYYIHSGIIGQMYATKLCSCLDAMALHGSRARSWAWPTSCTMPFHSSPRCGRSRSFQVDAAGCCVNSWMFGLKTRYFIDTEKHYAVYTFAGFRQLFFFWLPLYNNWCAIDELKVIWSCYEPCQFLDYPGPVSNINRLGLQWRLDHPTTLDTSSKTIISKGNPESHRTTARWNPTNLNKPPVICDIAMEISHLVQWFSYKNRDCP